MYDLINHYPHNTPPKGTPVFSLSFRETTILFCFPCISVHQRVDSENTNPKEGCFSHFEKSAFIFVQFGKILNGSLKSVFQTLLESLPKEATTEGTKRRQKYLEDTNALIYYGSMIGSKAYGIGAFPSIKKYTTCCIAGRIAESAQRR